MVAGRSELGRRSGAACRARGQLEPHVRAAVWRVGDAGAAAVRGCDRRDDSRPEACTPTGAGRPRAKRSNARSTKPRGKSGAVVDDLRFDDRILRMCRVALAPLELGTSVLFRKRTAHIYDDLSLREETHGTPSSVHLIQLEGGDDAGFWKALGLLGPGRAMTRFIEQPEGPGGPGRLIERRFGLWRWRTWATENIMASRARSGWSLRRSRALRATSDALDDYKLWMHLWMPASSADRPARREGARAPTASRRAWTS